MGVAAKSARLRGAQHLLMRAMRVRLASDLHERACDLGVRPPLDAKRRRWLEAVRRAGLIFIHIPKNGGMSVSQALYGEHVTHCSIRYYRRVAPRLAALPSFALIRDPVARFVSAYRYALAGGGAHNHVSPAFRDRYRAFASVDEALDHIEGAASPYRIDHIFRPQAWFITDRLGEIAVDRLIPFEGIDRLGGLVPGFPKGRLRHLNRTTAPELLLLPRHVERLRRLYARDFELRRMMTPAPSAAFRRAAASG
ncbi:MAG TPA: sulfotransferase family 2 domain-containing protein [Sphingomonas sp.]|nr:sulfotransferase family 2 domain-containing protein [Sphingomonas sp.]